VENYREKRRQADISSSRKRDNGSAGTMFPVPCKTWSPGYLADGANRFLAASPTAGGVGDGVACVRGGGRGGGRLSEAHFVGGRYGAAHRHPRRPVAFHGRSSGGVGGVEMTGGG